MIDTFQKSLNIFNSCPDSEEDLPYNYTSVIFNSIPLSQEKLQLKLKINHIQLKGRISIINSI